MIAAWILGGCAPVDTPTPEEFFFEIRSRVGIGDLSVASDVPLLDVRWSLDGQEVPGAIVPATEVYPGDRWTVELTAVDGRGGTAFYTVPEPLGGNVLVLLIDDVGVDKVGAYGWDTASPTPRIDALAQDGVRFTRAYASPVCSPTRGTLITGRQPRRTGLGWIVDTGSRDGMLPLAATTIPEALRVSRGLEPWQDGAIGKWHMAGPNAPDWLLHPLNSGFSWFVGSPGNPQYAADRGYYRWDKNVNGVVETSTTYMTTDSVDEALDRIDAMAEPWFLYVAFNAPHGPLNLPPAELVSGPLPAEDAPKDQRYDAVLEALDTEIGRLLDSMAPGVLERTTVMAIGDNGTSDAGVPDSGDLGRNKHTPYEGGIRVPFIVSGPHVRDPGRTSEALIHVADVLPTVADLAGVPLGGPDGEFLEVGGGVEIDGRSLLPHLMNTDAPGRDWVYAEAVGNGPPPYPIDRRAVQTGTHKLVRWAGGDEFFRLEGPYFWDVQALDEDELDAADIDVLEALRGVLDGAEQTWAYEGF